MSKDNTKSGLRIRYAMVDEIHQLPAEERERLFRQFFPVVAKKPETTIIVKGRRCGKTLTLAQEYNRIMAELEACEMVWAQVARTIRRFGYYRKEEAMFAMSPKAWRCVEPIWEQMCHSPEEMARQAFRQAWAAEYAGEKLKANAKGEDTMETKHKYKAGDKVRIVKQWPADGSAFQNSNGLMDKYLGKTLTIKQPLTIDGEPAYSVKENTWTWWESAIQGLYVDPAEQERIVITREGNITLARLFRGRKLIHRAEAICSPKDEYDFAAGAEIAFTRLMEKVDEERMEAERIKEGDKVKVIGNKTFRHHFEIGELVTVFKQGSAAMWLCESSAGLIQAVDPEDVAKEAAR